MKNLSYLSGSNFNTHVVTVASAVALLSIAACGSVSSPDSNKANTASNSAASSAVGAASAGPAGTSAAPCGNANAADGNTVASNPNSVDPNAFIYAYVQFYTDPNGVNDPTHGAAQEFVLTADPNACDTGTLTLHVNEATFIAYGENQVNTANVDLPLVAYVATSAGNGQCNLFGDSNSGPYIGKLGVRGNVPDPNTFGYSYELISKSAPLLADPLVSGFLAAKACSIPTDFSSTVTVPCVQ
jgi:hypothetical protein